MFLPHATSRAIAAAALLGLCAACASQPQQQAQQHEEKIYRTGSNIAVKDYGIADNVQTVDPKAIKGAIRSTLPGITPGTVNPNGGSFDSIA